MRSRRNLLLFVAAAMAPAVTAHGAEAAVPDTPARYSLEGVRIEPIKTIKSGDSRFRLESRLEHSQPVPLAAGAFSLRAKLVDASATACADPSAIFSNGFE